MLEIEHKFLIKNDAWRASASVGVLYRQGYIKTESGVAVRVRIAGDKSFLTLKGKSTDEKGISRLEYEYEIPLADAEMMTKNLVDSTLIEKHRYLVEYEGKTWEVDVFSGDNAGLEIAEIELSSEDEKFALPDWVGECVSGDPRYYNSSLTELPYKDW